MSNNNPARLVSFFLLACGLISLSLSIIYTSSILAFIGLGLTFWGALTLYVGSERYVKQSLLDSSIPSSLMDIDQILTELGYQGKAVYLPPKYLKDFETNKIYIPKNKTANLPPPQEIQKQENKIFLKNSEAALITPPGFSLSKLFETALGTTFTKVDLEYIEQELPKLLIEELEIAEDVEIETVSGEEGTEVDSTACDTIHIKITDPILQGIWKENRKSMHLPGMIGCPITSAIACALTKATGKPLTIENIERDGKIIKATYHILEPVNVQTRTETGDLPPEAVASNRNHLLRVASIFTIAFGSAILSWVGWITWFDMKTWGKGLFLIFFGSRTGEFISLGIGMRIIYYFLVGLTFIVCGLTTLAMKGYGKNNE